jgi:MFS family permease
MHETAAPPVAAHTSFRGRGLGLLIVTCAAFFLDALDVSMVNVALPSVQESLGVSIGMLQWVVAGYVLGFGGFLLFGGRAADLLGRRRVFLIALGAFVALSIVGGLATNGEVLIASRFLKGVAAAFVAPAALSLLTTGFAEGPARNRALSFYTATGSAGFTFGLIFGGLLTEIAWRAVFFMPAIVGGLTFLLALWMVPRQGQQAAKARLDIPGALAITIALSAIVFGLTAGVEFGWSSPITLVTFVLGAVLLPVFVRIERRHPSPLVPLSLFRSWELLRSNLTALVFVGGWGASQFLVTLYMQETRGWSALATAAAFWPCGVLGLFIAPFIARLVRRLGLLQVLALGLALAIACYALLQGVGLQSEYWIALFPSFALIGVAFTLVFSTVTIGATRGIPDHEQGLASGVLQTATQFGTALMLALSTLVYEAALGGEETAAAQMEAFHHGWLVPLIAAGAAFLMVVAGIIARRKRGAEAPIVLPAEPASQLAG